MRPAKKTLAIAIPLAALAISGCGGGGDSTASTPVTTAVAPTLTKDELIAQGDAICAEVNAAVGSVDSSDAEASTQIVRVSDLYTNMVESIKGLGAPEEAAGYSEFLAAAEGLSKVEGEARLAAEREDTVALGEAASNAAPALEEFETAAGEYGFENCSEGPSAPVAPAGGTIPQSEAEGGVEVGPEDAPVEEEAPEEVAPETGGAGGGVGEGAPEGEAEGGGTSGGGSGGIGPG